MNRPPAISSTLSLLSKISRDDPSGWQWVARWRLIGDRWQHEFALRVGDVDFHLATSAEGEGSDGWPLSPPWQQIHSQRIDGNQTILGLGMARGTHWSAAAHLRGGTELGAAPAIVLDFAATRTNRQEPWQPRLRSTYILSTRWGLRKLVSPGSQASRIELEWEEWNPALAQNNGSFGNGRPRGNGLLLVSIDGIGCDLAFCPTTRRLVVTPAKTAYFASSVQQWGLRISPTCLT